MQNEPKVIILNQDLVRQKLRQKQYDDVCLSCWGRVDEFTSFLISFGIFNMLAQLGLVTGHSGIPVYLLAMLAFAKPLFGLRFDDNIKYLFQDHHVLRVLGFTIQQITQGYSKRTTKEGSKPLHPDTLRNFLKSLGYKETVWLFVKVIRKLFKLGLIRGGLFAIDSKIVFKDSPGYEYAKKVYDYKGKHKNRRGYKISLIQHLRSRLIVAVIITPANIPDSKLLLLAVRHAVAILGEGVIKTILFDKGYWDGATLSKLKRIYHIDFMVPAKAHFVVSRRLVKKAQKEGFTTINPGLEITRFENITDAPNYEGKLQAIVVKDKKAKKMRKTEQPIHVYLTSLPWKSALALYQTYRDRWTIENTAIKELCQYWILEDFHCTDFNAIRAHIFFCALLFNMHILFKSKYGRRFTEKTVATKKAPGFQKSNVVVYYKDFFGIFDIQEFIKLVTTTEPSQPP